MNESGREPAKKAGAAPGQRLREERERRGISTQKVAEDLHVDVWVVEALEAGRFHALGAPVFVRGHLRKYATLLGLDAEMLVTACGEQQGQEPPLVPIRPAPGTMQWRVPRKSIAISAGVMIVAAAAGWGLAEWQSRTMRTPAEAATGTGSTDTNDAAAPPVVPVVSSEVSTPAAETGTAIATPSTASTVARKTTQAPAAASAEPRGYVRVRLNFTADSWVEVHDAEQRRVFADLCAANTARSLTVNAPARLAFGYPEGVQMEVNGEPVALPAGSGDVLRVTLDSQGRVRAAGRQANR
jgi:cytoskeleton protein RodZ